MAGVRRFRTEWLSGGLHMVIIILAVQADEAGAWPVALAAMSTVSFFAWIGNYRRYRQVEDIPTSKVASAAQGYVELVGRSVPITDSPVLAPLSQLPCCWYRYTVEAKDNENNWHESDSGESVAHFLLVDDTGECVVSPDGAEVLYARKSTWEQSDHRYTEWLLVPKGTVYVLGEFRTVGAANLDLDENRDVSNLLADWKHEEKTLIARFDANGNGALDLEEWERARQAARDEVQKEHAELRSSGAVNLLCKPADGRPFLLAGCVPEQLGKRFERWAWVHLTIFFGAGGAALVMVR